MVRGFQHANDHCTKERRLGAASAIAGMLMWFVLIVIDPRHPQESPAMPKKKIEKNKMEPTNPNANTFEKLHTYVQMTLL